MKEPLFHLVDKTPVFRGDKLHVHPSYWRQAGAVVTAEFEGETRECGQVVVRSGNGAVPSLPFAALTRKPHPDVADCKAIALLLDCDVHEVSRRDLKLWRASHGKAPATPQVAIAAAPSDARKLCDMYQQLAEAMGYHSGEGGMEFSPEEWASALLRDATAFRALTQPTTVQQAAPVDPAGKPLNDAGWAFVNALPEGAHLNGHLWNNLKPTLKVAIEAYLASLKTEQTTALPGGNGEEE